MINTVFGVASLRDAKRGLGVFALLQSVASLAGCVRWCATNGMFR